MQRAGADVGLMFVAYNLRRIINILGKEAFKEYFSTLACSLLLIFGHIRAIIKRFKTSVLDSNIYPLCFDHHVNQLIFTRKLTIMAGF